MLFELVVERNVHAEEDSSNMSEVERLCAHISLGETEVELIFVGALEVLLRDATPMELNEEFIDKTELTCFMAAELGAEGTKAGAEGFPANGEIPGTGSCCSRSIFEARLSSHL